jgi:hypothetical protein
MKEEAKVSAASARSNLHFHEQLEHFKKLQAEAKDEADFMNKL